MVDLIHRVNGNIKHTGRLVQLHKLCSVLNIPINNSNDLHNKHGWFSGFFDADGTIGYYFKNGYPQLTISVTNKLRADVIHYGNHFNGNIYFDTSQNGYYK